MAATNLQEGGGVDAHVHSFEESFYVLEGTPLLDVVAEAARLGLPAPVNAAIVDLALRVERGEIEPRPENYAALTPAT